MTSEETALAAAMDRIAVALHGDHSADRARLGRLTLHGHQVAARSRLLEILASFRGAILADAVGLGKTYVALAVAREHRSALVICPAALRVMWTRASVIAGVDLDVMSIESISRGERPTIDYHLIIVDEAHHLRTHTTRRYLALASMSRRARLLLMSATPVQNSRRDLSNLVALFAGSSALDWTDAELARVVVRRDATLSGQTLPELDGPHELHPAADDDCLDLILAMPPAVPAADEGVAHALVTISLVHLWGSSRAALVASLRKRQARAIALSATLAEGRLPTQSELRAWALDDDTLQLAFPFCASETAASNLSELSGHVEAHHEGLLRLLEHTHRSPDPDLERARLIRTLLERHRGERIVAFSQYASTISALGSLLRAQPGIATVTGGSARIASGPVPRDEVLSQFADGAPLGPESTRIRLLLTTDLLSEGVDLRGASVVLNLDLPWNPARLEQRLGRARRLGSRFTRISAYTMMPPAAAERMLALRERLLAKVAAANAAIGTTADPFGDFAAADLSVISRSESLRQLLARWIAPGLRVVSGEPLIGAARGRSNGWIALVNVDGTTALVQQVDGTISLDEQSTGSTIASIDAALEPDQGRVAEAQQALRSWLRSRGAASEILDRDGSVAKRQLLARLSQTVARAPRHRQPAAIAAAHRAKEGLAAIGGLGAEDAMRQLALSSADDESWMRSVEDFGASQIRRQSEPAALLALILLVRQPPG